MSNPYFEAPEDAASSPGGGKKLALLVGLAFFPGLSGILAVITYVLHSRGADDQILFFLLVGLALILAFLGLAMVMVAGFLLLLTGVQDSKIEVNPDELLGTAAPAAYREIRRESSRLQMRPFWLVPLFHILLFAVWAILRHNWPDIWPGFKSPFLTGGVRYAWGLDLIALGSFFYFWLVGLARVNRAGVKIPGIYYLWPALAALGALLALFFLPPELPPASAI